MTEAPPRPGRGLALASGLVVLNLVWSTFAFGGLGHYVWTVAPGWCLAAAAASVAFLARARGEAPGSPPSPLIPVLALAGLALSALAPLPPHDPYRWCLRLLALGAALALGYASWVITAASSRARDALLASLAALGSLQGGLALLQAAGMIPGVAPGSAHTASGTLLNRNLLAGLLEATLFVTLALALDERRRRSARAIFGVAALVQVGGAGVAASRGGWMALAAGAAVLVAGLALSSQRRGPLAAVLGLGLVGAAVALGTAGDAVRTRAATLDLEGLVQSEAERRGLWQAAWRITLEHPWTGVGLGNFKAHMARHRPEGCVGVRWYPVQDYLQTSSEGGFPALAWMLSLQLVAAWSLVRAIRAAPSSRRARLPLAALASLVALSVHGLVDFNFRAASNLGALVVLVAAALARRRTDTADDRPAGPSPAPPRLPAALAAGLSVGVLTLSLVLARHDSWTRSASRAYKAGDLELAVEAARRALEAWPSNPYPNLLLADALLGGLAGLPPSEVGARLDEAEAACRRYIRALPTEAAGELLLAKVDAVRAHFAGVPATSVRPRLESLAARFPNDPEILVRLGRARLAEGEDQAGYQALLEGYSQMRPGTFRRDVLLPASEDDAVLLSMAPAMPAWSVEGWSMLAGAFARLGDPQIAYDCWQRAIAADPRDPGPRLGAVAVLVSAGLHEEAQRQLAACEPLLKGRPSLFLRLLHAAQDDDAARLEVTLEAVASAPGDARWGAQLVADLRAVGREEDAVEHARALVSRLPEAPQAWLALGRVLEHRGQQRQDHTLLREAGQAYREAQLTPEGSAAAGERLARLYLDLDEPERAEPVLRRLLDEGRISPAGRVRLARLWWQAERPEGALNLLEPLGDEDLDQDVDGAGTGRQLRAQLEASIGR